jgi:hypothetical protein
MDATTPEVLNFQYFCDEMIRFREYISRRDTTEEQREAARYGFSMVYFTVKCPPEEQTRMASYFKSQMMEFERREFLRLQCSQLVDA